MRLSPPLHRSTLAAQRRLLIAAVVFAAPLASRPAQRVSHPNTAAGGDVPAKGSAAYVLAPNERAAGEYLTTAGGCNDCHTPGWAESNGRTPSAERLVGSRIGYRGPWGTTYATNLREVAQRETENEWVHILTTADGGRGRPPMPWMNTAQMSERDLRAMYRYLRALGPRGERMPRALSPDSTPRTQYINFVPVGKAR